MKKTLLKSIVLLLAVVMLFSTFGTLSFIASATAILTNGDFESGLAGFTIERGNWTETVVETVADPSNNRVGNVLSIKTGDTVGSLHAFSVSQAVEVKANTDYVWEFWIQPRRNTDQYIGVVAGSKVNTWKNTTVPITATVLSGEIALSPNITVGGAQCKSDGTADPNWLTFPTDYKNTWKKVRINFNSGDNTVLSLAYGARAAGREILFDDWTLYEKPEIGSIHNGDFENGLEGFTVTDKVIASITVADTHGGDSALKLSGVESAFGNIFYQEVEVEKNTDYMWSFWYKSYGTQVEGNPDRTSMISVGTANGSKLLPSMLKTDAMVTSDSFSFTELRDAVHTNWHESLFSKEWKKYSVIFNSGEQTVVRLAIEMVNNIRSGVTDDWKLSEYTFTSGDADNDGTVDAKDLVALTSQLLTNTAVYYSSGADMDNSGKVDIIDLIKLKKMVAISPYDGYQLVWADDFGGQYIDKSKWMMAEHFSLAENIDILYDYSAVSVENGSATLTAGLNLEGSEKKYYTSAALSTGNSIGSDTRMAFRYGYLEMRAKIPTKAEAYPALWMKSIRNEKGEHGEIDIFEQFADGSTGHLQEGYIQSGIHKWDADITITGKDATEEHLLNKSIGGTTVPLDDDWHNFGFHWTAEKLDFLLDGEIYHTIDISGDGYYAIIRAAEGETAGTSKFSSNDMFREDYFYLILGNGIRTDFADKNSNFHSEWEIDYVRLYQNADGSIKF